MLRTIFFFAAGSGCLDSCFNSAKAFCPILLVVGAIMLVMKYTFRRRPSIGMDNAFKRPESSTSPQAEQFAGDSQSSLFYNRIKEQYL